MPPKKASPAAKTAPKTTTQRSAARATSKPVQTKKPNTTAAKPGASDAKAGATAKKGGTSPTKRQTRGKEISATPQVLENDPSTNVPFLFPW